MWEGRGRDEDIRHRALVLEKGQYIAGLKFPDLSLFAIGSGQ